MKHTVPSNHPSKGERVCSSTSSNLEAGRQMHWVIAHVVTSIKDSMHMVVPMRFKVEAFIVHLNAD